MKQIFFSTTIFFGLILVCCSCSQTPESIKKDCLSDKVTKEIYDNKTTEYCNCLEKKLKPIADTSKLEDSIIENVKQSCANEYTSLDTKF